MAIITPELLAKSGTEDGEQSALFCFAHGVVKASTDMHRTAHLWALLFAIPNGGKREAATAARLKATGVKAGFPDIGLPVARQGFHGLWIEMKKRTERGHALGGCSELQIGWHHMLALQGYCCLVAYGWEEARDYIDWYLNGSE